MGGEDVLAVREPRLAWFPHVVSSCPLFCGRGLVGRGTFLERTGLLISRVVAQSWEAMIACVGSRQTVEVGSSVK